MIVDGGIPECNIIPNGAIEKDHFLRQKSHPAAKIGRGELTDVHASEGNGSL